MNRTFALLLCLPFIVWLWKRDARVRPKFSRTFWIPILWLLILGSRPISWWLGVGASGGGDLDGNWFDRTLYLVLVFLALRILIRRRVSLITFIQKNKAFSLFYLFLLITVLWAPFPFVAFKRWFKDAATFLIILLVLSEQEPLEAIKALCARCAFVWFPLSELFAKYFPQSGRSYSRGGLATYTGVTDQKNSLGAIILVVGLVLVSELTQPNRPRGKPWFKGHRFTVLFTLAMGIWLMVLSNSKTSLICFALGSFIILSHKVPVLRAHPGRVLASVFTAVFLFFVAESVFRVSETLLSFVGRDATFTDRTAIWEAVTENPVDPMLGCGYMMYWTLHRGVHAHDSDAYWTVKTAHNGYLETYLDGGTIGVCLLLLLLIVIGKYAISNFLKGSEYGRLSFAFFIVTITYNLSESIFARRSPLWFVFLLFAVDWRGAVAWIPKRKPEVRQATSLQPVPVPAAAALG